MQPDPDRAAALAALDAARRDALLAAVHDVPERGGRPLEVALSRPGVPWARPGPWWLAGLREALKQAWDSGATQRFKRLALHAHRSNRELVDHHVGPALFWLAHLPWLRSIADLHDWSDEDDAFLPRLAAHLVQQHPVPPWLLAEAWAAEQPRRALLQHVTGGGSLRTVVGTAVMPAPLTRRMRHRLLSDAGAPHRAAAVRAAQWSALGGDPDQLPRLAGTPWVGRLGDPATEARRQRQMTWVARRAAELDLPVAIAYIDAEALDPTGRSPARVSDEARRWHAAMGVALQSAPPAPERFCPPAPWSRLDWEVEVGEATQRWTTQQLRTRRALYWEGQRLRHCVGGYWHIVTTGKRSIWSVRCNNRRVLTVEVDDVAGTMRQISGFANRTFTLDEEQVLRAWTRAGGPRLGTAASA